MSSHPTINSNPEALKCIIAEGLFEGGFGEDPLRNWEMASRLIADTRFLHLCEEAKRLRHYSSSTTSMMQAKKVFWELLAHTIYEVSLGLQYPSDSPDINWQAAKRLEHSLVECWQLLNIQ